MNAEMNLRDPMDNLWLLAGFLLVGALWLTIASLAVFQALTVYYLTIGAELMTLGIGLVIETTVISSIWPAPQIEGGTLPTDRVAVLPFVNAVPDPNEDYFADGMMDETITTLSNIRALSVISRASTMRYRGVKMNPAQIGRELGAGTILEGSVKKAGDQISLTLQLLDTSSNRRAWTQGYDRQLEDVLEVQSDVATKVTDVLKVKMLDSEAARIKQRRAENIAAYTFYLKGRFLWNKGNKDGVMGSLDLFQQAIESDSGYARAYAGLADAYYSAASREFWDRTDGMARSKQAATKALEMDDTLAEAHASLGLNLYSDLRYGEAQGELQKAVALSPSYAPARHWYSLCLLVVGQAKEALEEATIAHELDPKSPVAALNVGRTLVYCGKLDEAIAIYDWLIANEPSVASSYGSRSYCFMLKRMKEQAYADANAWGKLIQSEEGYKLAVAELDLWFGETEKASSVIEELLPMVGKPHVSEMDIAILYAIVGRRDEFFDWIDRAITAKRIQPAFIRYSPVCDQMREDLRFPEIFKKLGVPHSLENRTSQV